NQNATLPREVLKTSKLSVSSQVMRVEPPEWLKSRGIVTVANAAERPQWWLSAHRSVPGTADPALLARHSVVSVWPLHAPFRSVVLTCEGDVTACAFGPEGSNVVVAGTAAGSLLLWDLREFPSMHQRHRVQGEEF